MRVKNATNINTKATDAPTKWKPKNKNYSTNVHKTNSKSDDDDEDDAKIGKSTEKENNLGQLNKSTSGKSNVLSIRAEGSGTFGNGKRKLENQCDVKFKKKIVTDRSRENVENCVRNGRELPNIRKRKHKIVDPYENPLLDYMYRTCLILERQYNN